MTRPEVPRAFDEIAPRYDDTREPLDAETLAGVATALRTAGVGSLLEVGVGTGRIAGPLAEQGFALTGVDASRGMIGRARSKGLERLVLGSAYRLPFANGTFDASLFVHVLHLLDDPVAALREALRVGRRGAFALVHPPLPEGEPAPDAADNARRIVYRILRAQGHAVPDGGGGPPQRERAFLARHPPDSLLVLSDRTLTRPVAERLDAIARGAHRATLRVPPEDLRRAVEAARAEVGDRRVTVRVRLALARWSSVDAPTDPVVRLPGADR